MNRLVYLFELDSAGTHDVLQDNKLIFTPALSAIFREIIKNGNSIAITMNQLVDSPLILEIIADDAAYEHLVRLFELGAIRVSLYGDICSTSQYLQQSIEKCLKGFYKFSALPVYKITNGEKEPDRDLLNTMLSALKISDMSKLYGLLDQAVGDERKRYKILVRCVEMILQLSVCKNAYIPQKQTKDKSKNRSFYENFLKPVLYRLGEYSFGDQRLDKQVRQAVSMIWTRGDTVSLDQKDSRTGWRFEHATNDEEKTVNSIIDLCYNYKVEDSINGISKHYDDRYFPKTFVNDFMKRFEDLCLRMFSENVSHKSRFVSKSDWKQIVRFAEYQAENRKKITPGILVYERGFWAEKRKWVGLVFSKTAASLIQILGYVLAFYAVELGFNYLESFSDKPIFPNSVLQSAVFIILLGVLGSLINRAVAFIRRRLNTVINKIDHDEDVLDILESIRGIGILFKDLWSCLFGRKYDR